jgi:hypothetical protein
LITTPMSSRRRARSHPDKTSADSAPARRPDLTAQASTGPATHVAVIGMIPVRWA